MVLSIALVLGSAFFAWFCQLDEPSVVCLLVLSGFLGFFNTGHRMTFRAIPIAAGFIGLPGFHAIFSFVLVFFHTYIVYFWVVTLMVMVILLMPRTAMKSSLSSLNFGLSV